MKEWKNTEEEDIGATPPPSDNDGGDDGLVITEGKSYIKEGNGYTTDEDDEIEPSQMDKIVT